MNISLCWNVPKDRFCRRELSAVLYESTSCLSRRRYRRVGTGRRCCLWLVSSAVATSVSLALQLPPPLQEAAPDGVAAKAPQRWGDPSITGLWKTVFVEQVGRW